MKKVVTDVEQIQPGMRINLFFGENNVNNCTVHVRAIVDDNTFVIARWSQRKGYYQYSCEDRSWYVRIIRDPTFRMVITGQGETL